MRYNIVVQRLVNDQPEHVFVQHAGIREGKVQDLFTETVMEQYDRLERAGGEIEFRNDFSTLYGSVIMQRAFTDGAVTTVHVFAERKSNEAQGNDPKVDLVSVHSSELP